MNGRFFIVFYADDMLVIPIQWCIQREDKRHYEPIIRLYFITNRVSDNFSGMQVYSSDNFFNKT